MRKTSKALGITLLTILSLLLSSCDSLRVGGRIGDVEQAPTTLPVKVDPAKEFEMVEKVTVCDVLLSIEEIDRQSNVSEGIDLIVITVNLDNQSGEKVPINTFDFTLVDSNNSTHTDAMASVEQPLGSPRLEDGDTARGMLTYRIPSESIDNILIWQPGWCTGVVYIDLE